MQETVKNMLLYGIVGHPVKHSLSPKVQQAFAKEFGISLQYDAIDIEPDDFECKMEMLKRQGYLGLNITAPFKETAYRWANQTSSRAQKAGAVSLLYFQQNNIIGDNADGIGFIRDVTQNHQLSLHNRNILLLGAGGAARGILMPILECKPNSLHIANRTVENAKLIAEKFSTNGSISVSDLNHLPTTSFDIIINTTSFGVADEHNIFPETIFSQNSFFYDLVYNIERLTPFLQLAAQHDATKLSDGLGMLVEQAAESFFIWHHKRPNTKNIIQALKNKEI